jgi:hypothetical protein
MDWNELRFHLTTALYVCATSLGAGLFGLAIAKVLP